MTSTVWGVVKEGIIVPDSILPEGARVEIRLPDTVPHVSDELRAEVEAWGRASDDALALVEHLAAGGPSDEAR